MNNNKYNFVRNNNGVIKLPPGFRFQPTDEELVFQYLRCKVFSCPLPPYSSDIVPEINLCNYDPWDLPSSGDLEQDRYFFSNKEAKYKNGNRSNRRTSSGYWKATGSDKKIVSSTMKHIVGTRKTLVFYRGKPPHGARTDWFMHEYTLTFDPQQITQNQTELNWVLCRIFYKDRSTKKDVEDDHHEGTSVQNWRENNYEPKMFDLVMGCNVNYNNMGPVSSSASSSSSSSSFTDVTSSNATYY
ncbi:NAC domain-containing protein 83-like [Humulus lupulus]|uniref:NAC domain-containing protein 83-like n=1 Tax=Humulus lupulus TaxID=3486 RepID=UPI002B4161D5|nr:NAC domain-containing protein 83-like [Humulus lupulus]